LDEARWDLVFLGDEDIRILRGRHDNDGVCFDLDLQIRSLGDIAEGFAKRDIRE
jgi:hypothetical protein